MRLHRMYAILLRHLYLFRRNYDKMTEAFYWPIVDLVLWGITSSYISKFSPEFANLIFALVGAVLFWNLIIRGQGDVSMSVLEDIWNKNLINIFVSPLTLYEWLASLVSLSVVKAAISFLVSSIVAFILYKVQIFTLGFYLIPFFILLMMTGWWLGFFLASFILRYGTRVQTIAWTMVWVVSPLSAVYFPLNALPQWVQTIAMVIPSSYVFEGMREVIQTGKVDPNKFIISFVLNVIYLILSIIFFKKSFQKVLQKGLVKVF